MFNLYETKGFQKRTIGQWVRYDKTIRQGDHPKNILSTFVNKYYTGGLTHLAVSGRSPKNVLLSKCDISLNT